MGRVGGVVGGRALQRSSLPLYISLGRPASPGPHNTCLLLPSRRVTSNRRATPFYQADSISYTTCLLTKLSLIPSVSHYTHTLTLLILLSHTLT